MSAIESDAIGGFNGFLAAQKAMRDGALLTLVLFNHEYEAVHTGLPIHLAEPLTAASYTPCGTTALLDAVGRSIVDAAARHEALKDERPSRVVVAILTDGLENASRDYRRADVSRLIERQQRQEGWHFVYLGANQNAFAEARALSLDASEALVFDATPEGVQEAYQCLHARVASYRLASDPPETDCRLR